MTAKEYLSQVLYIDQRINCKLEQVMRLRENATKATATLSDMPHSDSPNLKSMENTICKIVDLEREINRDIDQLVDLKAEAREGGRAAVARLFVKQFGQRSNQRLAVGLCVGADDDHIHSSPLSI